MGRKHTPGADADKPRREPVVCLPGVQDDAIQRQLALVRRHSIALGRAVATLAWLLVVRGWDALVEARELGVRESARRAGWLLARAGGFVVVSIVAFVLVGALVAARVPGWFSRAALVTLIVVALPLGLRRLLAARLPRGVATSWNGLVVLALLLLHGRDAGAALRRHGDWFLGWRSDASARTTRACIVGVGRLLERFAAPPQMLTHELSPDEAPAFYGPWRPGETPYPRERVWAHWFHPLGGARTLPLFESRRFGAARPQPRPAECELGHCGVDLAAALGAPVYAVADGVVERVERDAADGGRAGRFVRIGHLEGAVVTRYIHLSTIRRDLRPGQPVAAGELLGTVGRSGVAENFPHLHFGLSWRNGARREVYVDPEPFLQVWELR